LLMCLAARATFALDCGLRFFTMQERSPRISSRSSTHMFVGISSASSPAAACNATGSNALAAFAASRRAASNVLHAAAVQLTALSLARGLRRAQSVLKQPDQATIACSLAWCDHKEAIVLESGLVIS
jgi:hypothetical protein